MILISLVMIEKPDLWVKMAVRYLGLPFILYADKAEFPATFKVFGSVLVAVGIGFTLTPPP